jgi:phosphatidylglycerol---prolipoprotein diacylglyceryl transferase
MIPYFRLTQLSVGPLHIQVWGLFVSAGVAAALLCGRREARRLGLNTEIFLDMAAWMFLAAIVAARLFYAVIYDPLTFLNDPWELLRLWDGGMSIFGGFFGALAAGAAFARWRRVSFLQYADVFAFVLPLGCAIGRVGCFLIHDHPGILTNFFLAVAFPDGARLDHGLLLSLLNLAIFSGFLLIRRLRPVHHFPYLAFYALIYGAARFGLDFLRAWDLPAADVRYLWLTPAQYSSLAVMLAGIWLMSKRRRPSPPKIETE